MKPQSASGYPCRMAKKSSGPLDPRVARTRRDVIRATVTTLLEEGWEATTHAEVARRAGYSKATVYAHWPTPGHLLRDAIARICEDATQPPMTGDLRSDLHVSLSAFATALSVGRYDRLMAGVIERAAQDADARELRDRLYETATTGVRTILATRLAADDVDPCLAMLVGAVLVRTSYEGKTATPSFITDIIDRVLGPAEVRPTTRPADDIAQQDAL